MLPVPFEHHRPDAARAAETLRDARPRLLDGAPVQEQPDVAAVRLAQDASDQFVCGALLSAVQHSAGLGDGEADVPQEIGVRIRIEQTHCRRR